MFSATLSLATANYWLLFNLVESVTREGNFMDRAISLLGLLVMVFLAWLMSSNRKKINFRIVAGGLLLQFTFALLVLKTKPGRFIFEWIGSIFEATISCVDAGSEFMFSVYPRAGEAEFPPSILLLRSFAFGVLPTIIFFSSLMSVLYHLGIMQRLVSLFAMIMQKTLGTSGAESLSAAANIFVGQTEAPLVVRPYINAMTMSELNAVMVGGFATIAGGVMAAFVGMGIDAGHLVTASVISAPAALLIAKIMQPETETPKTLGTVQVDVVDESVNVIEAAAAGASAGMKLAINVAAMLIAFLAMIALANTFLGWLSVTCFGLSPEHAWKLEQGFSYAFYPFAWIMGVPQQDCMHAGELLGLKMVANEFIAFDRLGAWVRSTGDDSPDPRTVVIMTYALAGFANLSSIGIQIGGIGAIAPDRRSDLARLGFRAMLGGTLAAFMTACIAGVLVQDGNSNLPGNNSDTEISDTIKAESESTTQIGSSGANSTSTCRQAPHGKCPPEVASTIRWNERCPAEIALNTAMRSAQTVIPNEAFSTLQPPKVCPESVTKTAPT